MQITRAELERYRDINKKIDKLDERIDTLKQAEGHMASDKVSGSSPKFPYETRHYTVKGYIGHGYLVDELEERQNRYIAEADVLKGQIDAFLDTIGDDDAEIRETIEFYYLLGYSRRKTAKEMGLLGDGSAQMQRLGRYLKGACYSARLER